MFDGISRRVLVFWLRGKGYDVEYNVRVVLEGCDGALDVVLEKLSVNW